MKPALITGAGSGIGRALATETARRGYHVHLVGRRESALQETADLVRADGGTASVQVSDVSSPERMAELASAVDGPLDLLILNAGVTTTGPLLGHTLDDWEWVYRTVLGGVVLGVQHFVPAMVDAGRGTVLVVGSQAGLVPDAYVDHGPYISAKSAVISLGLQLNEELRGTGVKVSTLVPAGVSTGFSQSSLAGREGANPDAPQAKILPRPDLPTPTPGSPVFISAEDVARIALDGVQRGDDIIATHHGARPMVAEYTDRLLAAYEPR